MHAVQLHHLAWHFKRNRPVMENVVSTGGPKWRDDGTCTVVQRGRHGLWRELLFAPGRRQLDGAVVTIGKWRARRDDALQFSRDVYPLPLDNMLARRPGVHHA